MNLSIHCACALYLHFILSMNALQVQLMRIFTSLNYLSHNKYTRSTADFDLMSCNLIYTTLVNKIFCLIEWTKSMNGQLRHVTILRLRGVKSRARIETDKDKLSHHRRTNQRLSEVSDSCSVCFCSFVSLCHDMTLSHFA